jgi:N-glycosylase/DNA lyase
MRKDIQRESLSELARLYAVRRSEISKRLEEFSRIPADEYFYELVYCLLTPQSSAQHAGEVVDKLRIRRFREVAFDAEPILADRRHYIRFHRTKGKRLLRLRDTITEVHAALDSLSSPAECRQWLVENVDGLGLKEATHFLRNIGKNGDLAILDRHILRNLMRYGVIRSVPPSLGRKEYHRIERRFQRFAESSGIPINHLDLLFWSLETGVVRK